MLSAQLKPESASLKPLQVLVEADLKRVNLAMSAALDADVPLIHQLSSHIIASGGKRLRPSLTLAASALCGYQGDRHIRLAAAVEFIHTATLLHDDVVDDSALRRGEATANALFGNQASVLVGDFLFSRAFQFMVADGSLEVLRILSDASAIISKGEVKQLMVSHNPQATEDDYFDVIGAKTAALFAAACEIGAVVADKPEHTDALREYGYQLGLAFQLIDDALDYVANQQALGKTVGDDFREGKMTLPIILAYAKADEEERRFWHRTLEDQEQQESDFAQAVAILHSHDAISQTITRARECGAKALTALNSFPPSTSKAALVEAVEFCISREY